MNANDSTPDAPEPAPGPAPEAGAGAGASTAPEPVEGAASPYRNLWVPLVVVPAVVVGVIVLVFALFGQISGSEDGLDENLVRMIQGGKNEREQAAFNLVRQVFENREAEAAGNEPVWVAGPDFPERLREAWTAFEGDDNPRLALVVATLMAEYADPEAIDHVASFLELAPADDPDGQVRILALRTVADLGRPDLAPAVIRLLGDEDAGLRLFAASVLQRMPGEATLAALREKLNDPALEMRGQAAVSLSHLGDASGGDLLVDMTGTEIYTAANEADPTKFARGDDVRRFRAMAIQALARLGRARDRLAELAESEPDIELREVAIRALEAFGEPAEGPR